MEIVSRIADMDVTLKIKHWLSSLRNRAVIQGFWHGEPLSALHWACLRSFLNAGHDFDLYTYEGINVPDGIQIRDAAEIVSKDQLFFFDNPHTGLPDVAPFADYFRLKLLFNRGGWWCDVDTICCSRRLPRFSRVWARQAPEFRPESVSNGQLYFKPRDWVLQHILRACEDTMKNVELRESLGPDLVSQVLGELGLPLDMGATATSFYPIRYVENFKLWLPEFHDEVTEKTQGAIFLPVYQSFPRHLGFDNSKLPPVGSYLHNFIRKHAPEFHLIAHDGDEYRAAVRKWFQSRDLLKSRLLTVSKGDIVDWLELKEANPL